MQKLLSVLLIVFTIGTVKAQQAKEGSITYSMEALGVPEQQAAMMKGMENQVFFKNGLIRSEVTMAFGSVVMVKDKKGNFTILNDMMGKKTYIKKKPETEAGTKKEPPSIKYTDEKKTIAGYECQKAIIEQKDESGKTTTTEVWYTEKIAYAKFNGGRNAPNFEGLKGAPLEFETSQRGMTMKMVATKVSLESVSDSKFAVSTDGYLEIKEEDMRKMGAGAGAGSH